MSAKDLIPPYLNRFVSLNQQKSTAKLELSCIDGKITVNLLHDLGVVGEATSESVKPLPAYSEVLQKTVRASQVARLQRRAKIWAEEAMIETKNQQDKAENAKKQAEKALADAEEAKISAEKAKEILLKVKAESDEVIRKSKIEAEKAKELSDKCREEAEKAISKSSKEIELANNQITKAKGQAEEAQNLKKQLGNVAEQEKIIETLRSKSKTVPKIEIECEYCGEEFSNEKVLKEHGHSCPICKNIFKEEPYCLTDHIRNNHEEFICNSCGECFTLKGNLYDHTKKCFRCDNCYKFLKTYTKLRKHKRKCISDQEEYTDESSN